MVDDMLQPLVIEAQEKGHIMIGHVLPDCSAVLSGGFGGTLREWKLPEGSLQREYTGHTKSVNGVCAINDWIVSGATDGNLNIWNKKDGSLLKSISTTKNTRGIISLLVVPERQTALVSVDKWAVQQWKLPSLELVNKAREPGRYMGVKSVSGNLVAVSGYSGTVFLYNLDTLEVEHTLESESKVVSSCAFVDNLSANGKPLLLSLSHGGELRLWDIAEHRVLAEQQVGARGNGLAYDPTTQLAALSVEHAVLLYHISSNSMKHLGSLPAPAKGNYAIEFSSDYSVLALASADKKVRVWNTEQIKAAQSSA